MSLNRTNIEWVKNPDGTQGYTWNPLTGCLNHNNGLCKGGGFPCYAYRLANGRLFKRYTTNDNYAPPFSDGKGISTELVDTFDPFYPRFWPERLPVYYEGKPKGIFVCDMSDLFGIGIPESWTREVLGTIKRSPIGWRFYLLTKQPQNLIRWSPFPDNCWVGVTVTSNAAMTMAYYGLSRIEAKVKFISFEPLLGSIGMNDHVNIKEWVDWVIIGRQAKPTVYPQISWVEEIVDTADKAGIPVFMKDNLAPLYQQHYQAFRLRQELPVE